MNETWKDVVGFEWLYEVNNFGNIKSLPKIHKIKNWFWYMQKEKILKQREYPNWYLNVCLYKDWKSNVISVHRIVATAFIKNLKAKETINHKDHNKKNNNINNLERMTQQENNIYSRKKWINKKKIGEDNVSSKKIVQKSLSWKIIKIWDNWPEIKKELWYCYQTIQRLCRKEKYCYTAYWYKWEYI